MMKYLFYNTYIFIVFGIISCSSPSSGNSNTLTVDSLALTPTISEKPLNLNTFVGYWVAEDLIDSIKQQKEYYTINLPHKAFLIFSQIKIDKYDKEIYPIIGVFNNGAWGYDQEWINEHTLKVETADSSIHLTFSFNASTQKITGEVFENNKSLATCNYSKENRKTADGSIFSIDDIIAEYCLKGEYIDLTTGEWLTIGPKTIGETEHYGVAVEYHYLDKLSTPLNLMTLSSLFPKEEYDDDRDFKANACWEWHQDTLIIYKLSRPDNNWDTPPQKGKQVMVLLSPHNDFKAYFYALPTLSLPIRYTCYQNFFPSDLPQNIHSPDGASLLGTLPPIEGYYPILYSYPADIVLPILIFYDRMGTIQQQIQLLDLSFCNAEYPEQYSSGNVSEEYLIEIENYILDKDEEPIKSTIDTILLENWFVKDHGSAHTILSPTPKYDEASRTVLITKTSTSFTAQYLNYRYKTQYNEEEDNQDGYWTARFEIQKEDGRFVPIDNCDFFNAQQTHLLEKINQQFNAQYFAVEDRDCVNSLFYSWTKMNELELSFDKKGVHFHNDFGFPEVCKNLDRPKISMTWQEIAPYLKAY